jgi:hypothetical protein
MKRQYQAFVDDIAQLSEGKEVELNIKDLTPGKRKYDARLVTAVLYATPERLPDGDILWLRGANGLLHPTPWVMQITREMGDYLPLAPYSDVRNKAGL